MSTNLCKEGRQCEEDTERKDSYLQARDTPGMDTYLTLLRRNQTCYTLILDIEPPTSKQQNKVMLFNPPCLWFCCSNPSKLMQCPKLNFYAQHTCCFSIFLILVNSSHAILPKVWQKTLASSSTALLTYMQSCGTFFWLCFQSCENLRFPRPLQLLPGQHHCCLPIGLKHRL